MVLKVHVWTAPDKAPSKLVVLTFDDSVASQANFVSHC
jgi:hypothetical protein